MYITIAGGGPVGSVAYYPGASTYTAYGVSYYVQTGLPVPPVKQPVKPPPPKPTIGPVIKKIIQVANNLVNPASLTRAGAGAFRDGVKNIWNRYLNAAATEPTHASQTPLYRYLIRPLTGGQGKITVEKRAQTLQDFMDQTEGISQTIDIAGYTLSAAGGILDGISSGTTYYQEHPGQGVARAVFVGAVHGVFSTGLSILYGMAGEIIGGAIGGAVGSVPVVTDEVTTPTGAIVGGIVGAIAGSYAGSVDGDWIASQLVG